MTVSTNSNVIGIGGGVALTTAQISAGATGVIASDSSGNAYKQDGTAFTAGGAAAWGSITGTLSAQTDLSTALAAKASTATVATLQTQVNTLPSTLVQCGVPIGILPSTATVTISTSNLVTTTNPFLETYSGGIYLYFAAAGIDTGSAAGFYWCVMSGTGNGTVYTATYTPGTNTPVIPTSPTPFVSTAGGVNVGTTSALNVLTTTLPAGAMGNNGAVRHRASLRNNNSAGTKGITPLLAATGQVLINNTASTLASNVQTTYNLGVATLQNYQVDYNTGSTGVAANTTVNTAVAQTVGFQLKLNTATDWMILRYGSVELIPAA